MDLSIPQYQIPDDPGMETNTSFERVKLVFACNNITEIDRKFLQKVSISTGVEEADCKILERSSMPFSSIRKIYPNAMFFLLGDQANLLLPHFDQKNVYKVFNVDSQKIVFIHDVKQLIKDVNAKKHLWQILKTHFVN